MSLELPPPVRFGGFFRGSFEGVEELCFCCALGPLSKMGGSSLHSTRFDYSSF